MTKIKSAQEWAEVLWSSEHASRTAADIIREAQAEAWEAGREAAANKCERLDNSQMRQHLASQHIRALTNPYKKGE